jgi:IclR family KDG regulon transcriptional repressor
MKANFKRVPALDKCFTVLDLLAKSREPMGVSEIAKSLTLNKSTVFNIVHTLADLKVLEHHPGSRFGFGIRLYILGRAVRTGSEIINTVRPYLEIIVQKTNLSAFLGTRSADRAVIVDKVDSNFDIKISSEIGMQLPLLAGAGGKALLSQISDAEIDRILSRSSLKRFTPFSCIDKRKYKKIIEKVRRERIAVDMEEYIEDIRALAVPLEINRGNSQFAIWAVGLKKQITHNVVGEYSQLLKKLAAEIEIRLACE